MEGFNFEQPQEEGDYKEYTIAEILEARAKKIKLPRLDPEALKDALSFFDAMESYKNSKDPATSERNGEYPKTSMTATSGKVPKNDLSNR